jgi:microcompartment protein CcmL/EutN
MVIVKKAIGMIELRSVARGMHTTDVMLKAADIELLRAHVVCPGKYIILIAGDVGAVRSAINAGMEVFPEVIMDTFVLPNVHPCIFPALAAVTQVTEVKALGIVETFSLASSIVAADIAVKAASIEIIEIRLPFAMAGKAFVSFTGDVSSVRTAVDSAVYALKDEGVIDSYTVIPSPHKSLVEKVL